MRVFSTLLAVAGVLTGCGDVHEVAPPTKPIPFSYQVCALGCGGCAGQPQPATLQALPKGTGWLLLKNSEAIGGADILTLNQCHFYSNGDWHCVVKPQVHMSGSLPNILAHAWFEREIGFNGGEYHVDNVDRVPSALQEIDPEMIQFDVCLARSST